VPEVTNRHSYVPYLWAVIVFPLHFAVALPLLFWAYVLYDDHWVHAAPAFHTPSWAALLFFLPVFATFGAVSAVWSRRWVAAPALPVLLAYFLWLGGMRASEYYQETAWDIIGRPPLATAVVGLMTAGAAALGWRVGARLLRPRLDSGAVQQ
jgi:hypothetical protein